MRYEGMRPEPYIVEMCMEPEKCMDGVWRPMPWYKSSNYEFMKKEGWTGLWSKNEIPTPTLPKIQQLLEVVAIVGTKS
jgi:hypothetical protein